MDNILLYDILVGSVSKGLKKAKSKGSLELYDLHLLSIFGKLLNDFNSTLTLEEKSCLEQAIRDLQYKNSYICNYKHSIGITGNNIVNIKPIITNTTINIPDLTYNFKFINFTSTFTDVNNDLPDKIRITSLPIEGNLKYNGSDVSINDEFTSSQITSLLYTWTDYLNKSDSFTYQVSDNNENNPLFSDMATMTLNITAHVNLPPSQVGILSLNIENSTIYTFTTDNFTVDTTPIYLDPDGDNPENLKITSLPTNGSLEKDGITLVLNDIISFSDIALGKLNYVSDSLNKTSHTGVFNFSISDEGSHQFTSGGIMTFNIAAYVNQAATVGDGSATVDEGNILTFTKAMFTTNTNPPYSDPEGDLPLLLRITQLPASGTIKLNNVAITANQEISFSDIDLGLLIYTQSANAGGTMPIFNFQIKDVGSNTWAG
mgnify:CR=1 FL=1